MGKILGLKNNLLWILRWAIYPPAIYFVLYLILIYNYYFTGNLVWWKALPVWALTSIFAILSVAFTGLICPNRKYGNFFFLGMYLLLEVWSFTNEFPIKTSLEIVLRIWADLSIIAGFVIAATVKLNSEKFKTI